MDPAGDANVRRQCADSLVGAWGFPGAALCIYCRQRTVSRDGSLLRCPGEGRLTLLRRASCALLYRFEEEPSSEEVAVNRSARRTERIARALRIIESNMPTGTRPPI